MKKIIRLLAVAFLIAGAFACQKGPGPSAKDTLPFPIDVNKDTTTDPGDDFWQYCNGAWYAQTPTPATDAVGGMNQMQPVMDEMVAALIKEDPSLKRFYQLSDELYANSDAAMAFLQSLAAKYPVPQNRSEGLKLIGRLIMDGLSPVSLEFVNDYKDGKLIGMLAPPSATYKYSYAELPESVKPDLRLIAEGMGVNPETLYYSEQSVIMLNIISSIPDAYLISTRDKALESLYPFASEALNASLEQPSTPQQVRDMARACLNYLISNRLAAKYVSPELKQHYMEMIEELRDAFRARIQRLDWMSETTRNNALDKLEKMMVFAGYPDKWYDDCLPDLSQCKSLVEAVYLLKGSKPRLYAHLVGTSDAFSNSITSSGYNAAGELLLTDLTLVNAQYRREYNSIFILPAFMLPPLVSTDVSEAIQYGALFIVAHEITHGFDSEGSKYDAKGRMHNWWTVADQMAFEDEQKKLVQCYSSLEYDPQAYPGQYTDGNRTLAENIADLGGFLIARDAYAKHLQEQGFNGEEYSAQLRKFHEAVANLYCVKYSAEKLNTIVTVDNHSHCRLRTNGVVMNTDMWYDLYNVTRENKLYLPEERRTYIW